MPEKTKRILGIHAGLVFAELVCVSAFALEIGRALSGNTLSWAYVFEWPIFAGYAIYMWRRFLREEIGNKGTPPDAPSSDPTDQTLERYNEYLREVHDRNNGRAEHLEKPING